MEIDFEADPVINITIQVTDRGGLTLRRNFSVRVEDVNESPTKIRLSQNKVGKMTLTERNVWILNLVILSFQSSSKVSLSCKNQSPVCSILVLSFAY